MKWNYFILKNKPSGFWNKAQYILQVSYERSLCTSIGWKFPAKRNHVKMSVQWHVVFLIRHAPVCNCLQTESAFYMMFGVVIHTFKVNASLSWISHMKIGPWPPINIYKPGNIWNIRLMDVKDCFPFYWCIWIQDKESYKTLFPYTLLHYITKIWIFTRPIFVQINNSCNLISYFIHSTSGIWQCGAPRTLKQTF